MCSTLLSAALQIVAVLAPPMPASTEEVPPERYFLKLLGSAKELELYSIDPSAKGDKDGFHGYKVLGKTTVKDAETLKGLVAAFRKGIEESEAGAAGLTPDPRHGIRFVLDKTTVDLLLCSPTRAYYDGKKGPDFAIAKSPQVAFDKVLKAAGVEVAKPAAK